MIKPITLAVGPLATNCYLVIRDGSGVVIDPGDGGEAIAAALKRHGVKPDAILLTHGHFDHIGEAAALRGEYRCPIYIGRADAGWLADPAKNLGGSSCGGRYSLEADRLLRDGETVQAGGLEFQIIETPGHTPGGVCYLCEDALFCGDTLFRGSYGRVDFPGGSWPDLQSSLRRLAQLPPETRVFPGHGPSTTIGEEQRGNPALGMMDNDDLY